MLVLQSHSPAETEEIGRRLAAKLQGTEVIAMFGGLGMGKTAFVRGLADGLGIPEGVSSPTFALVHQYDGIFPLYHFDMYRVNGWDDLYSTGFFDYLDTGILVIEWSENIENALPREAITVSFVLENETTREITINGEEALLKELTESYAHPGT